MSAEPSHRRRFAWGLLVALVAAVGLSFWMQQGTLATDRLDRATKRAIISLRALTELVGKGAGDGEVIRALVSRWAEEHPDIRAIRVVSLRGAMLVASTAAADTGEKAAPRRLSLDEKSLFDAAQSLRAAVATNRQEGAARKEEIEVEERAGGGLRLATPYEQDGTVVGMVEVTTLRVPEAGPVGVVPALAAVVAAMLVFALVAAAEGERIVLTITAAVLLLATMTWYGRTIDGAVLASWRTTESSLAALVKEEKSRATAATETLSLGPPSSLHAGAWDADVYGRPTGMISDEGEVNREKLDLLLHGATAEVFRLVGVFTLVGLGLLAFVGLSFASRVWATVKRFRQAYAYATPALLGMLLLVFLPFMYGVVLSFTDSNIYNTSKPIADIWVGLRNYVSILGDLSIAKETPQGVVLNYENFYWTAGFTVVWTVSNVAYGVAMGLFLALILNTRGLFGRPIYRVIFILPWAIPNYITALIWRGMFHQQFGVVNQVIQMFGGAPIAWFDHTPTSFFACLATNAWLSVPFMMVISLGALQSIPAELYEAARVDGATRWQQFTRITLPSLKPALVPAIILSVIWTFNMFNIIYLVSAGEPAHSTEILITEAYKIAFEQYRYGYAAAYSMVIFVILFIYGAWQNRVTRATEGI
jgi:arabinogalactan oligomer/maltooligosaccharide transport system permease protein